MKNIAYFLGTSALANLALSILLKLNHWYGAGSFLKFGSAFNLLIVFPIIGIYLLKKKSPNRSIQLFGLISLFVLYIGIIFKIQHYPSGELIQVFGTGLFIVAIVLYSRILIIKQATTQIELSTLKAQINPHFLFNNLNTIYSMASQNDQRTPEAILKLSDFLRYVLYDTSGETIPLEKEIEIIRIYVDLQKERASPDVTQIELTTKGEFSGAKIAPLLLLPLAENCFKHGKGKDPGLITIQISFDGKELRFHTTNSIIKNEKINKEKNGGIGISNVEKRLELIYPNNYSLKYEKVEGIFDLDLKIIL